MTREDAKREILFAKRNVVADSWIDKAYDMAIQALSEPEPHWIPCSKRLPEDGRCLVTRFDFVTNTCFLDILWYEKGVWWNRLYTGNFAVIAWTPLPEPYRGGGKE